MEVENNIEEAVQIILTNMRDSQITDELYFVYCRRLFRLLSEAVCSNVPVCMGAVCVGGGVGGGRLIAWDGMGWDGMGWDGMEWDGMGLNWMGPYSYSPPARLQTHPPPSLPPARPTTDNGKDRSHVQRPPL